MNTAGNSNRDLREPVSLAQRGVVALVRALVPPQLQAHAYQHGKAAGRGDEETVSLGAPPTPGYLPKPWHPTQRGQRKRPQFPKGDEGSKRMLGVPGLSEDEGQRAIYQPA